MTKPALQDISASLEGWDDEINANNGVLRDAAMPIYKHTGNESDMPAASSYAECLLLVNHSTLGIVLYHSTGSAWRLHGYQASTVTALTDSISGSVASTLAAIPDPADTPASADALRDDLVANTLPKIRNALSSIASTVNSIRTQLRASGLMA